MTFFHLESWVTDEFLDHFNKFCPKLSFSHEFSGKNITFLHLDVKILDRQIVTDPHIKATYKQQSLYYTSLPF